VVSVGSVVAVVGGGVVSVVVGSVTVGGVAGSLDGASVVVGSSESVVGSVTLVGGPRSVGASLSSLLGSVLAGVSPPAAGRLSSSFAASLEVFPFPLCPPTEERRRKRRQRESTDKTAILIAADLVEPRRKMRNGAQVLPTQNNGTSPSGMYPAFQ
jgi:hypothetical protein